MSRFPRLALLLVLGACERAPGVAAPPAAPPTAEAPPQPAAAPPTAPPIAADVAPPAAAAVAPPPAAPVKPRKRKAKAVAATEVEARAAAPRLVTPPAQPDVEPIRMTRAGPKWHRDPEPVRVRVAPKATP